FAKNVFFPAVQFAAEILPLPLIHKGFALRRPIAGWKLGTHAHSLRLERVIVGRGYSVAARPVNRISLTKLPGGTEPHARTRRDVGGSDCSPEPVDRACAGGEHQIGGEGGLGFVEAGRRGGSEADLGGITE